MNAYQEARFMLSNELRSVNWNEFSDSEVRGFVHQMWDGGWEAWVEFSTGRAVKQELTDIQKIAYVQDTVGCQLHLGLMDAITDHKFTEDEIVLVIDYYELTEYHNRLKAVKHATKMIGWKYKNGSWVSQQSALIWDEDFVSFQIVGQYGRVTTHDIYRDRVWQDENCYRPGTSRTPMDGYTAENPSLPQNIGEL